MSSSDSIRAGKGHVELGVKDEGLRGGLKAAEKVFQDFAKGIAAGGAAIGAMGASMMAPMMRGLSTFSDWGRETSAAMRETGMSFARLDELMDGMRVSGDELTSMSTRMSMFLEDAIGNPASEAAQRLRDLRVSADELNSMSAGARMMTLADAIARIGDPNQRIAFQRAIFRSTGANIEGGSEGIRARADRADFVEGARTEADLTLAKEYNTAMREMNLATKGFWATLGSIAAGPMKEFYAEVVGYIIAGRQWVEQNKELLGVIFRVGMAMVGVGAVLGVVAGIVYGVGFAFGSIIPVALKIASSLMWIPNLIIATDVFKYSLFGVTGVLRLFGVRIGELYEPLAVVDEMFDSMIGTLKWLNSNAWAWIDSSPIAQMVIGLAGAAAGAWAIYTAFNFLIFNMGVWSLLTSTYAVGASVAMGVWKLVMLGVNAVVMLFNFNLAATNFFLGLATGGSATWSVGALFAKAATWLFNAALTAMNVLLGAGVLIAAAATVYMLAIAFTVVGAAAYGVYHAVQAVFGVLMTLPTATGPIAAITSMFGEWADIIKTVYETLSDDTPAAMAIMRGGFTLAVNQIKDLWPPLWTFVKNGFYAVWDLVADTFMLKFRQAIAEAQRVFREMALEFVVTALIASNPVTASAMAAAAATDAVMGTSTVAAIRDPIVASARSVMGWDAEMAAANRAAEAALAASIRTAEMRLAAASAAFSVVPSPATVAASADLAGLMRDAELARYWREVEAAVREMFGEAESGGSGMKKEATGSLMGGFGSLAALSINGRVSAEDRAAAMRARQLEELRRISTSLLDIAGSIVLRVG